MWYWMQIIYIFIMFQHECGRTKQNQMALRTNLERNRSAQRSWFISNTTVVRCYAWSGPSSTSVYVWVYFICISESARCTKFTFRRRKHVKIIQGFCCIGTHAKFICTPYPNWNCYRAQIGRCTRLYQPPLHGNVCNTIRTNLWWCRPNAHCTRWNEIERSNAISISTKMWKVDIIQLHIEMIYA